MIDTSLALRGTAGVALLVLVSFAAFIAGMRLRNQPDQVRSSLFGIDGSIFFLAPEVYRRLTTHCGTALIVLSFVALLAAGIVA